MRNISTTRDRQVTVTLKDGTECSGRLFMTLSTTSAENASTQPRKFIYLQIGESRRVVRFNVSEVAHVAPMAKEYRA